MNELQVFNNSEFGEIRAVDIDGTPYAVGVDVARALEYAKPSQAVIDHCKGIRKLGIPSSGGTQETNVIPEGDIYRLVIKAADQSRNADIKKRAERFERWVFDVVLPSIRHDGGYINASQEDSDADIMAKAVLVAQRTIERQKAKISTLTVNNQIMAPKAEFFDELVDRNLLTGIRETAKELGIKQNVFVAFLITHKYLYRDKKGKLQPYAGYVGDLFELKETFNEKTAWSGTQLLINPKGRETFRLLCVGMSA